MNTSSISRKRGNRSPRLGLARLLALGAILSGCGAQVGPGNDSTTHFWQECVTDSECGTGSSCFCGRCSTNCGGDSECDAQAVCRSAALLLDCEESDYICVHKTALPSDSFASDEPAVASDDPVVPLTPVAISSETEGDGTDNEASSTSETHTTSVNLAASAGTSEAAAAPTSDETSGVSGPMLQPDPDQTYASWSVPWSRWVGTGPQAATGCQMSYTEAAPGHCRQEWQCNEHDTNVVCGSDLNGGWDCGCQFFGLSEPSTDLSFSLDAADEAAACQTAFAVCTSPEPDAAQCTMQFLPPEELEPYYECQWKDDCGAVTSDAQSGGSLLLTGFCFPFDGYSICWCDSVSSDRSYIVTGASGNAACAATKAACTSAMEPEAWLPGECQTSAQQVSDTGECQGQLICPLTGEISPELTALTRLATWNSCWERGDGTGRTCRCSSDTGRFYGELQWLEPEPLSVALCVNTLDVCDRAEEIVFDSEPVCVASAEEAIENHCSRTSHCTNAGLFDEQELIFEAEVGVACEQSANGEPWRCSCGAGGQFDTAELEGELTSVAACDQQFAACLRDLAFNLPDQQIP